MEIMMQGLVQDLRYGARMLRRTPGVTAVAVLSLALGIGANVTNFSLANALLFRPLPVEDPDRLVVLTTSYRDSPYNPSSYADYRDLRDHNEVFSGMVAYTFFPMGLKGKDRPEVVMGQLVTWNFFDVLGVQPVVGRPFLPEEEQVPNGPSVAILSHRIWQTRFGSDPKIIGGKVLINSQPFEVVGVAPRGFYGLNTVVVPDVWVPVTTVEQTMSFPISLTNRYDNWLAVVGRLKSGLSLAQAQAGMDLLAKNMAEQLSPDPQNRKGFMLVEADRSRAGLHEPNDGMRKANIMLMCLVGLVLLIACFNVANLLLARATQRQKEIAVRLSLGASRWRILRQLLTESLMLSLLAGAAGMLFALWGVELLMASIPTFPGFLIEIDASPDVWVLGFTLLLSLASGVIFGLAPALQMIRPQQLSALRDQSQAVTRGRAQSGLQDSLVVAQVAVSVILLVSAGLFIQSLRNALQVDPGFDLRDGLVVEIDLGFGHYDEPKGRQFYDRLVKRVQVLPGVEAASLAVDMPLSEMRMQSHILVDGYESAPEERMQMRWNVVGPGYFETLGVPIVQGRGFTEQDREDSRRVAVINETMARRYWAGRNAIGGYVRRGDHRWEIIGIAKEGKYDDLDDQPKPYVCFPLRQEEFLRRLNLVIRTSVTPVTLMAPVLAEIRRMDTNLPAPRIMTMEQFMENAFETAAGGPADLLTVFGLLALALAMIGVYGVMSYSVSRRTHEFGIRMALGARRGEILGIVLRKGLKITLVGLLFGLAAAIAVARLLGGFLFEVNLLDPVTFSGVILLLLGVATAACYLPAHWAAQVSPAAALRDE
jgi:predicted permease